MEPRVLCMSKHFKIFPVKLSVRLPHYIKYSFFISCDVPEVLIFNLWMFD